MKVELQYRTFEELLASVVTDIPHLQLENSIEPQQLIKVVTKINYELGLRINANRTKLLEIQNGKTRLPADFAVANYALYCGPDSGVHPIECDQDPGYAKGLAAGLLLAQEKVEGETVSVKSGEIFSTTLSIVPGENRLVHNLHDTELLVQVLSPAGEEVFTRLDFTDANTLVLHSDAQAVQLNCTVRIYAASRLSTTSSCKESCQVLSTEQKVLIRYQSQSGRRTFYRQPELLRFVKSKGVDSECQNLFQWDPQGHRQISIQQGFLITAQRCGHLVLSYQSVLEDEDGSLLTLDHPKVNDYYENALKEKIYENLWLSGEDVFQKLDYLQQRKLRPAKLEALSFVNTPSYGEFRKVWELNRKAQFHKYYQMFC